LTEEERDPRAFRIDPCRERKLHGGGIAQNARDCMRAWVVIRTHRQRHADRIGVATTGDIEAERRAVSDAVA